MRLHVFLSSLPRHLKLFAKENMVTDEKNKQTPSLCAVEPQSHSFSEDMTSVYLLILFLNSLCYTSKQTQICFGKKKKMQTALTYLLKRR